MSRAPLFNHPLLLGFDEIERFIAEAQSAAKSGKAAGDGYPPYNIERFQRPTSMTNGASDASPRHADVLRISLAVAGFSRDDLEITIEDNQITIAGKRTETEEREYLHRGIAARQFQRTFVLADGIEVAGAELENGLLLIDFVRPQPERIVRKVEIKSGS